MHKGKLTNVNPPRITTEPFKMNYPDEFHYETYEICYAIPNNVLYGINNDIYFVDTPIRLKE